METLKELFPNISEDSLKKFLRQCNNNVESTINAILVSQENKKSKVHPHNKSPRNKSPRNIKDKSPKGWTEYSSNNKKKFTYYQLNSNDHKSLEQEFPSLVLEPDVEEAKTEAMNVEDMASASFLESMFPYIDINTIRDIYKKKNNITLSVEELLINRSEEIDLIKVPKPKIQNKSFNNAFPEHHNIKDKPDLNKHVEAQNVNDNCAFNSNTIDNYYTERKNAIKAARKRNKLFMQAARAYDTGDHSQASKLAQEGHNQNEMLRKESILASERIFASRNPTNNDFVMDLHGLTAQEALGMVMDRLMNLAKKLGENRKNGINKPMKLDIITGWGKGQTALPILRPTIQEFLTQNNISFRETSPGRFQVFIKENIQF